MERPAVMVSHCRGDVVDEDFLARGVEGVGVGRADGESAKAIDRRGRGRGVVNVDVLLPRRSAGEVGIERDPVDPALDLVRYGEVEHRRRLQRTVLDQADGVVRGVGDEEPPVRRESHRRMSAGGQGCDGRFSEPGRESREQDPPLQLLDGIAVHKPSGEQIAARATAEDILLVESRFVP
jgi:hypothetical protein